MTAIELEGSSPRPGPRPSPGAGRVREILHILLITLGPVILALMVCGLFLLAMGVNPLTYYGYVAERGLFTFLGLQQTATRMAPLLLLGAGLIVAFRAGIWNLGVDGQFLLGAAASAALAPALIAVLPVSLTLILCLLAAAAIGAVWSMLPALLRAYQGVNEIITTLMMSFLGLSLANVLVKLVFLDPETTVPQTRTLAVSDRLPRLFDTTISSGLLLGLIAVVAVHVMMTRTAFGLRLRVVGASARAATHAGLSVPGLTLAVFAISAGFAGLAGGVEILGVHGNLRADWNPAHGLAVIPLVFLARFNGFATILFVFLYAVLLIGGESAARRVGVPHYFTYLLVACLLIFLALVEHIDLKRRNRLGG